MSIPRNLALVLYVGYLVQIGLLMTVLPWSDAWAAIMVRLPAAVVAVLDHPAARGAISGFGVFHLAMVALELRIAAPTRPPTDRS